MTKTLIHQFLLDNDALGGFITAFHKRNGYVIYKTVFDYFDSNSHSRNTINGPFTWSETKEGSIYWSELDNSFRIYYKNNHN